MGTVSRIVLGTVPRIVGTVPRIIRGHIRIEWRVLSVGVCGISVRIGVSVHVVGPMRRAGIGGRVCSRIIRILTNQVSQDARVAQDCLT